MTTRARILAVLRDSTEPLTVTEVAGRAGVHANTVRFHLDSLLEAGRVEQVRSAPAGRGRPALRFRAVARMDRGGPRGYQALAATLLADLTSRPDPAEQARRAGRSWGRHLAEQSHDISAGPATTLITALADLDFAPEQTAPGEISLRHCPFLELTTPQGGPVCAIHLGLMQGLLADSAADVARLDPFVTPDRCVATLR
ncbi:helix-turn-helix transcriptional regulator [Flexivirga sp.]|uniref:helix-turn-helix transcriptional regulator n=1 Tax=Flexivirga sp. TaxID=1962927 RepID=UPI003F81F089